MKLYEVGKYFYLSPTRAPWEMYEIQVNREKWEALPEDLKAIFLNCLKGAEVEYHAKLVADNAKAVVGFKEKGVIVESLPSSIDDAFIPLANKYLKEQAAKHASMNEILTSQLKFEEMWKNLYGLPSPGK
jgi:TRAP-type mannitol/chloroaromatic compound transport system substrate-binding protein